MIHRKIHPLFIEGCDPCKWASVNLSAAQFTTEREGKGPGMTGTEGSREYVRKMFEDRRAAGMSDPIPENPSAAKFMPAIGVHGGKDYRKNNGGI